jgi:membrane-bound lytic murein transglycosylase A
MDLRTRNIPHARNLCLAVLVALVSCTPRGAPPEAPAEEFTELRLTRAAFSELTNWFETDTGEAFAALLRSCGAITAMPGDASMTGAGYGEREAGLFTGYFEPELRGSLLRHGEFQTPLYGLPADLVSVDLGLFRENLTGQRLAGRVQEGSLVPYDTRPEITRRGLEQAEELLYVDDPIDAFFLQIQGSGRVQLEDGSVVRASYAGHNGHPYTAIGAVLIAREELAREDVSMQSIRGWLSANPSEAQDLLDQNASYVFFSIEPLDDPALGARGTQGVPLTAEASLAVDASAHPLGAPIWLETTVPRSDQAQTPFHRLLIAQDTGGAIRGAVRGDIYWGVGEEAGEVAGRMRSAGKMAVLVPRAIAENIGEIFVSDRPGP